MSEQMSEQEFHEILEAAVEGGGVFVFLEPDGDIRFVHAQYVTDASRALTLEQLREVHQAQRAWIEANPLVTVSQIAGESGIPTRTIQNACASGELPAIKVGRAWQFTRGVFEKWREGYSHRDRGWEVCEGCGKKLSPSASPYDVMGQAVFLCEECARLDDV